MEFAYIASMWFNHQRLFERYFVATPPSILINFVLLSMFGLVVYFVQVFGHMETDIDRAYAFVGYFAAFGTSLAAIGTLYAIGTATRWHALDPADRRDGVRRAFRSIAMGVALVATVAYQYVASVHFGMSAMVWLAVVPLVTTFLSRLALRALEPRIGALRTSP